MFFVNWYWEQEELLFNLKALPVPNHQSPQVFPKNFNND